MNNGKMLVRGFLISNANFPPQTEIYSFGSLGGDSVVIARSAPKWFPRGIGPVGSMTIAERSPSRNRGVSAAEVLEEFREAVEVYELRLTKFGDDEDNAALLVDADSISVEFAVGVLFEAGMGFSFAEQERSRLEGDSGVYV